MNIFGMRLYWNVGQASPPDPGLMALSAIDKTLAVVEADEIWAESRDRLNPAPMGYLIYEMYTRRIIHERSLHQVVTEFDREPRPKALISWRWRRFRSAGAPTGSPREDLDLG